MEYWVWLSRLRGVAPVIQKRLIEYFKSPEQVYNADLDELLKVEGIGSILAETIYSSKSMENAMRILDDLNKSNTHILTLADNKYPDYAANEPYSPLLLYYRGTIRDEINGIGIVGSRRCSQYGKRAAFEAGEYIGRKGYAVISGMAKGIDGYAHTGCIKSSGYTIAFFGTAIDLCYPKEHNELMDRIIDNGAVMSEYPPGTKGRAEYFPRRNYLISSWSKKLLVVEASERSGALITADIAIKQGKEVFALPSSIYSKTGVGTNRLISKGARIYTGPGCIVDKIDGVATKESITVDKNMEIADLTQSEIKILDAIGEQRLFIKEISEKVGISQIELSQHLAELELRGVVNCLSGRYWK